MPAPFGDEDGAHPVIIGSVELAANTTVAAHVHHRAQLLHATRGVMTATTQTGAWVVPPLQALWIPAAVRHSVMSHGEVSMRSVYVHPDIAQVLPAVCAVVSVSPFLSTLINRLHARQGTSPGAVATCRLEAVLLDELGELQDSPLDLPMPRDSRLRSITDYLRTHPADNRTLGEWGECVGASERTLARAFLHDTGLGFGAWRQRLRLQLAVVQLHEGLSVTEVAYTLGDQSASAFVAMFRRALGCSPGRYLRDGGVDTAAGTVNQLTSQ
jgi:AraC-like DNA-binding protein